jgi:phage FluMu gp28-like protein
MTQRPPKPTPGPARKRGPVKKIARAVGSALMAASIAAGAATAAPLSHALPSDSPLNDLATSTESALPTVLLGYQQRWIADQAQLKIMEKGRRTGMTWAEAADNVLIAASEGGSNVFYISATQDMAREYIEACAMWARAFDYAAGEIGEGMYDDGDDEHIDPAKRYIKTYEIVFPGSGRRIVALSSRPTNLRGKQGVIVIDEGAFAPDLGQLIKAAMAMLLWGDKVRIISTHDGVENPFNQLIQEVRAGKRGGPEQASVHRVTFRDAVNDGLYRRVCLRKGIEWTQANEDAWVQQAYKFYGDDAAEELDAVPSASSGAYLSLALIQQRMTSVPPPAGPVIVRGKWDDAFAYLPEDVRTYAIKGWIAEQLQPHLATLSNDLLHAFGQDFARNRDQSVIVILERGGDLVARVRVVIELANCPFTCQEQIMEHVIEQLKLRRWRGGAMDATGNGAALAEKMAQKYGTGMVEQVKLSESFYLNHMPKLRMALQDGTLTDIPRDADIQDDLRAIKLINGVPKLPSGNTQSAGAKAAAADGGSKTRRHGDFAIAVFLAVYAFSREVGEVDWLSAPAKAAWGGESTGDRRLDDELSDQMAGMDWQTGTW